MPTWEEKRYTKLYLLMRPSAGWTMSKLLRQYYGTLSANTNIWQK